LPSQRKGLSHGQRTFNRDGLAERTSALLPSDSAVDKQPLDYTLVAMGDGMLDG
jgi:hypothetical protein